MRKFHMISGLPRSGSTLLSSILNQNPKFSAGIENPLNNVLLSSIRAFSNTEYVTQSSEQKRINVLKGIIESYYDDDSAEVVFNSSRFWSSNLSLINLLYPDAKIICCVRDIVWIIDSFEKLYNDNPTLFGKEIFGPILNELNTDVYMRVNNFMQENSPIMKAHAALKTGFFSEHNKKMLFVEYDDLCKNPRSVMQNIYNFIEEPFYEHNFDDVETSYDEYDKIVQVDGLHKVRKKIQFIRRNTVIPPEIWEKFSGLEFWRQ